MAIRALRTRCRRMYLPRFDFSLVVAVKAEGRRFRNKEKGLSRAVGIMTYTASTRGDGPVNVLLMNIQVVAVQAQLFHGQDEFVAAAPQVTCLAQPRGIRAVSAELHDVFFRRAPPVIAGYGLCVLVGYIGNTIKKKAQRSVPGLRRTSEYDERCQDTSDK
jgi:hypothetical protein